MITSLKQAEENTFALAFEIPCALLTFRRFASCLRKNIPLTQVRHYLKCKETAFNSCRSNALLKAMAPFLNHSFLGKVGLVA